MILDILPLRLNPSDIRPRVNHGGKETPLARKLQSFILKCLYCRLWFSTSELNANLRPHSQHNHTIFRSSACICLTSTGRSTDLKSRHRFHICFLERGSFFFAETYALCSDHTQKSLSTSNSFSRLGGRVIAEARTER